MRSRDLQVTFLFCFIIMEALATIQGTLGEKYGIFVACST